jgi:glycosyltransferase involved in cell wall biosynthesis
VLSPTGVQHPLRPLMRRYFAAQLRAQCAGACAAAYVTEGALQRRYPPAPGALAVGASDVELPPPAFVSTARNVASSSGPFRLAMIGSLAQLYKAPDVLVDAISLCVEGGLDVHLTMIGDGVFRGQIEDQVRRLGLAERISFLGQLAAGETVRNELDRAHAFVLPSRTEGLPRALVEAMARGLPCIGSTVGGIPELLPPQCLVPPGDAPALAQAITRLARDPARQAAESQRNLDRARDFADAVLDARRRRFFSEVADATQAWLDK